jgi:hypothetical protein
MGLFKDKNTVEIMQEDLDDAKLSSLDFSAENVKKRAFVDVLGARLAMKILFNQKMEANNIFSMYSIQNILSKIDISDIYLKNMKIDIRLVFSEDEIFIPKTHFEYNILPDIYMILCLKNDLSSAEFIGFCEPDKINKENCNSDFYFIEKEKLTPAEELKKYVKEFVKTDDVLFDNEREEAQYMFISLADNELNEKDEQFLFNALAKDKTLRKEFVELENFENLSTKAFKTDAIQSDSFLDVVGAQEVAEEIPEGLEEVQIDINQNADSEESKKDKNIGLSVAKGAAIAGGIAAAGIISANAASAAEGTSAGVSAASTAAGATAGIAGAVADVAGSTVKGAADILKPTQNLDSAPSIEKSDEDFMSNIDDNDDGSDFNLDDFEKTLNSMEDLNGDDEGAISDLPDFDFSSSNEPEEVEKPIDKAVTETETETEQKTKDFSVPTEDLDDDDIFNSEIKPEEDMLSGGPLPEIDFSDESGLSLDLPKESDGESISDVKIDENEEEEISPVDQIKEDPNALEALQEKLKSSQLAGMPDYFKPEPEEPEDESEEPVEDIPDFKPEALPTESLPLPPEGESLVDLDDLPEIANPIADANNEQDDDIVSLDNFDFGMFNEDLDKSAKTETPEVKNSTTELPDIEPEKFEDYDNLVENQDSEEINDITSQVDAFLNDVQLDETQKSVLAGEINIDEDVLKEGEEAAETPKPQVVTTPTYSEAKPQEELIQDFDIEAEEMAKSMSENSNQPEGAATLGVLFNKDKTVENDDLDLGDTEVRPVPQNRNRLMITASVVGAIAISLVITGVLRSSQAPQNSEFPKSMNAQEAPAQVPGGDTSKQAIPGAVGQPGDMASNPQNPNVPPSIGATDAGGGLSVVPSQKPSEDMGKAVSNAFTTQAVNAQVSKVAWEVPENLSYNSGFRRYLQTAGKNLKLSLQSDLLLATEMAYSNKCVIDVVLSPSGKAKSIGLISTSGSKQIDNIVLQSVKETLNYLKAPASELNGQSADLTLIINF